MSDGEAISYLEPESDVVVVGAVAEPAGTGPGRMTALVVYAGSHESFVDPAEERMVMPTVLLYANVLFALVAFGLGVTLLLGREDSAG